MIGERIEIDLIIGSLMSILPGNEKMRIGVCRVHGRNRIVKLTVSHIRLARITAYALIVLSTRTRLFFRFDDFHPYDAYRHDRRGRGALRATRCSDAGSYGLSIIFRFQSCILCVCILASVYVKCDGNFKPIICIREIHFRSRAWPETRITSVHYILHYFTRVLYKSPL